MKSYVILWKSYGGPRTFVVPRSSLLGPGEPLQTRVSPDLCHPPGGSPPGRGGASEGLGTTEVLGFIIDFLDFNLDFLGFPIIVLGFPRIS